MVEVRCHPGRVRWFEYEQSSEIFNDSLLECSVRSSCSFLPGTNLSLACLPCGTVWLRSSGPFWSYLHGSVELLRQVAGI